MLIALSPPMIRRHLWARRRKKGRESQPQERRRKVLVKGLAIVMLQDDIPHIAPAADVPPSHHISRGVCYGIGSVGPLKFCIA